MTNGVLIRTGTSQVKVSVGTAAPINVDTGATDQVNVGISSVGPPGPRGQAAAVVVSPTEPTAADYGSDTIPLNAIWIQTQS